MASWFTRHVLSLPYLKRAGMCVVRRRLRKLLDKLDRLDPEAMDDFFELLLHGMDLALWVVPGYADNIKGSNGSEGFKGSYSFETEDKSVGAGAAFEGGNMYVHHQVIPNADLTVTFKNRAAFKNFLFAQKPDVLNSLLDNELVTKGNLNYIYRFGFLVTDLARRLDMIDAFHA